MALGESARLEELAALTGVTGSELLARMTELEIAGRIGVSTGFSPGFRRSVRQTRPGIAGRCYSLDPGGG